MTRDGIWDEIPFAIFIRRVEQKTIDVLMHTNTECLAFTVLFLDSESAGLTAVDLFSNKNIKISIICELLAAKVEGHFLRTECQKRIPKLFSVKSL